ncbi:hypothetical protein F5H01DRAFT_416082 [Linnemannia elongata]|nr:hypothetical protein F5H01DRAFT_416082 [Linnemannia elongata]
MHHYQPIPDLESGDIPPSATTTPVPTTDSKNDKDVESQLPPPPKYEPHNQQQQHADEYPPLPPSSTPTIPSAPQYPAALRKPWVILSLPIAIAVLISTSLFVCMSSSSSSSAYVASVYPAAIGQQQQQQGQPCATGESSFSFGSTGGDLSSSSWPRLPLSPVVAVVDVVPIPDSIVSDAISSSDRDTTFHSPVVVAQTDEVVGMNDNGRDDRTSESEMVGLGGIEIISVMDPVVTSAVEVVVAVEVDAEQEAREDLREDDYENDDGDDDDDDEDEGEEWDNDDEEEWEDDDEEEDEEDERVEVQDGAIATMDILQQVAVLEAFIDQAIPVPETVNHNDEMNLDLGEDGDGVSDGDSVVLLSLRRYDGDDEGDEEEEEEEDEDEQDHFPTNIGKDDDGEDDGGDGGDEDDQQGEKPTRKGGKDTATNNGSISDGNRSQGHEKTGGGKETNKHKHKYQDQNANLGGTGGNGPILLCSSKSCLPSLRDSILSKLSIQVRQVMNHLRSRHTLVHMMSSTAPQTKESLMAGQEELVQQLEDRVMKDLRDWVNGVGRKSFRSGSGKKAASGAVGSVAKPGPLAEETTQSVDTEVTVETEGLFLDGDEFEEGDDDGSDEGFHMASLSFEDADDDDEDHEDDSLTHKPALTSAAIASKNKSKHNRKIGTKLFRRDTSSSPSHPSTDTATSTAPREYFLSADKLLMRQEWSRWIAHWVHHTKLLILSHTLATQSLVEMNRIAISGENVVPLDQRHWSWNLDKALATVMVASEMICGGPANAKDVKVFLSTLSMSSESTVTATGSGGDGGSSEGMMSPKALAITLNAQKCIESWSGELEEILQRTATNA